MLGDERDDRVTVASLVGPRTTPLLFLYAERV